MIESNAALMICKNLNPRVHDFKVGQFCNEQKTVVKFKLFYTFALISFYHHAPKCFENIIFSPIYRELNYIKFHRECPH